VNTYTVGFELAADGSVSAFTLDYPVAVSASNRELARERIKEAIQIYREEMEASGFAIREPAVECETVTV
jgi:predicted RNase H-like HicB family nuclease